MTLTIKEFYKNSHIFITGGTGFVGIALIEKFLRDVPFEKMYLLARPKRGVTSQDRLQQIFDNKIIKNLNLDENELGKKFVVISGDIEQDSLGISEEQTQLLRSKVTVVIHSAASLDFGADLKETTMTNLLGTRRVLELCNTIQNLKAMIHVSSAYANADKSFVEEKIYPSPANPEEVLKLCQTLNHEDLKKKAPEILGCHVNMYTLTKALAEHEVANANQNYPTVIIRPSMIVGAWREPEPGWTISKNGPQGFFMGATNGVVRRLPVDKDLIYDYIPVDVVVNHILIGGWIVDSKRFPETPVYHATSSTCNPFTWDCLTNKMSAVLHDYPSKNAVWYPTLKLLPSILLYKISSLIFHFIPAIYFDTLLKVTGKKPKLIRLHRSINKSLNLLAPFIFNEWKFDNAKSIALEDDIPSSEKNLFYINITTLDWEHFFINLTKGVRRYLLNESDATLNAARKKDRQLMYLNFLIQILFFFVLVWIFQFITSTVFSQAILFVLPIFGLIMLYL